MATGVFRRPWRRPAKRRGPPQANSPTLQAPRSGPRRKQDTRVVIAIFWHKKTRPKSRNIRKSLIPAAGVTPPSTYNDWTPRPRLQFTKPLFRRKWRVARPRLSTPLVPPPAPVAVAALPKLRRVIVVLRASFWRRKPPLRQRRKPESPLFIAGQNSQLALVPNPRWRPRPRRKYALPPSIGTPVTITMAQASWPWTGNAITVNAARHIAMASTTWSWQANPIHLDQRIVMAQASWGWTGNPPTIITGKHFIVMAQATWGWQAQPMPAMHVWTEIAETSSPWTQSGGTTSPWTPGVKRPGNWTPQG